MKKIILLLSVIALTSFTKKSYAKTEGNDLTINTDISSVEWIGKKVTGEHAGTLKIKEGNLQMHDGALKSGKIVLDMGSIASSDMEGKMAEKLIGHLSSPDFFDIANHNTATLEITSTKKIDKNKFTIIANLTIKGITKPIEFPATIEVQDGKLGAYAEMKIDRTIYDIKYGSGKFFDDLGDKMIDDMFIIKFKIAAE